MKRGPKPKPTALKRMAGNPGKRPLNEHEPDYPTGAPLCPKHLDAEAKAEWARLSKILGVAGVLTHADRAVMTGYCETWSLYVEASINVSKYGIVMVSTKTKMPFCSPYFSALQSTLKQLRTFAEDLGLSPSSRSRITVAPTGATETAEPGLRHLKVV